MRQIPRVAHRPHNAEVFKFAVRNMSTGVAGNSKPIIRRRQPRSNRRRDGLIRYAKDKTSQNGEDGIIERIFELIEDGTSKRYCVDLGAWNGVHLSNTYSLLCNDESQKTSWQGFMVEADNERFAELKSLHEPLGNICIKAAISVESKSPNSLHSLLEKCAPHFPADIDFVCIDIDGSDYWVLHDLLESRMYLPKVVCIEFNPTMPQDLIYIPSRCDTIRHGASLAALVELASAWEYVLVETTLFNAFFVHQPLYSMYLQKEVPDPSIEALNEITMGTSLYQLYDGTIKLWGCKKLLWHRIAMDETKMQMLPPQHRNFPFAPQAVAEFDSSCVVDLSPYCTTMREYDKKQKDSCAQLLMDQLKRDGFAYVRGTGMSQSMCMGALRETKSFLSDANEDVRRSCLTKDRARRGYSPMCTENFASLVGEQGPNDLVRKFRIGPTISDHLNSSLLQPNVWPSAETWDHSSAQLFRSTLEEYYKFACGAANAIVRAICDACIEANPELSQTMNVLSSNGDVAHTSILTLLGYKIGSRHKRKEKNPLVAAHTDVGVITFLLFDGPGCAKLQRKTASNDWVDVQLPGIVPDDPIFVVNIGDCLSDISKGMLPSTFHRVVPCTNTENRHCLALFAGLDPQERLFVDGEKLSYEEWRKRRIAKAQNILKSFHS